MNDEDLEKNIRKVEYSFYFVAALFWALFFVMLLSNYPHK